MRSFARCLAYILVGIVISTSSVYAGDLTIPNVFNPGTPAHADSVNENFSAVEIDVDDNAAIISSLQSAFSSTRTGYLSLTPLEFRPILPGYNWALGPGLYNADGASTNYTTPLHLPHNSRIVSYTLYYRDEDATQGVTMGFGRYNRVETINGYGTITSSGSAGVGFLSNAYPDSHNPVDNLTYSYNINLYMPTSDMKFNGALIEYEYTID
jgi:hypothetical protein